MQLTHRPIPQCALRAACFAALTVLLCAALAACGGGGSGGGGGGDDISGLMLEDAFPGITFERPVKLVQHPVDDDRWYVVEQGGKIKTFLASDPVGTLVTVLDLVADGITLGDDGEQGLLGLAFDPDFNNGGELYITYTDEDDDDSILARYVSIAADDDFDPTADPIVLAIPHDESNHNGGDIMFGPDDDYLYYSMGDGGGSNDPDNNGQDTSALLGKVLRIDVLGTAAAGEDYAVPATNPFFAVGRPFCDAAGVGPTGMPCPEVFAYGLRNPWRMSFDMMTGDLWLGDVGQGRREEIDVITAGGNYAWDCKEGDQEGPNLSAECVALVGDVEPEAVHDRNDARAITGGVVYRGSAIPELDGWYVYGDYSTGKFFAFDINDSVTPPSSIDLPSESVSAFGQDRDGEVYVVTHSFGGPTQIFKLVP